MFDFMHSLLGSKRDAKVALRRGWYEINANARRGEKVRDTLKV